MKRLAAALALACLLSASALAGEIPTLGAPQPPPQGTTTSPGEIPSGGNPGEIPTVGSSATLSALLTVLGWLSV